MNDADDKDARNGSWGVQVLMVLIFGAALAVLGWFAAEQLGDGLDAPTKSKWATSVERSTR